MEMEKINKEELREKMKENPEEFLNEFIRLKLNKETNEFNIKMLQEEIRILKERQFGKKTEKCVTDSSGRTLFNVDEFNEAETNANPEESKPLNDEGQPVIKEKKLNKRKNLVNRINNLEEVVEIFDLSAEEKVCPKCGSQLTYLSEKVVYTLRYVPAKIVKVKNVIKSYYCQNCKKDADNYVVQSRINTCFPKLMVEPSIVSNIIYNKYCQYLPLYRQEKLFNNVGLDVTRANMCNWVIAGCNVLEPLYKLMEKDALSEDILHMDETTLTVLDNNKSNNYIWGVFTGKHSTKNIKLYYYNESREYKTAMEILKNYKGYIQSDGYKAYQNIPNTINVGCMAHARRKFVEIEKALKKQSLSGSSASEALGYINKLYSIEHKIEGKSIDEIERIRNDEAKPILEEFYEWCLDNAYYKSMPNSSIGKAVQYFINNYEYLKNYLLDGRLSIDNNLAERGMKSFVMGRKNFLFCITEAGANKSCIAYSIVESARANNLKVEYYLNYVFNSLSNIDILTEDDYRKLLPYSKNIPNYLKSN